MASLNSTLRSSSSARYARRSSVVRSSQIFPLSPLPKLSHSRPLLRERRPLLLTLFPLLALLAEEVVVRAKRLARFRGSVWFLLFFFFGGSFALFFYAFSGAERREARMTLESNIKIENNLPSLLLLFLTSQLSSVM